MKNIRNTFVKVILISALFISGILSAGEYSQDKKVLESSSVTIKWKGYKVTGEHEGFINLKSGTLLFTNGELTGGEFKVDMKSIRTTDLQGEYAQKLNGHLKSDDFFGVENFPVAELSIVNVKKTEAGLFITAALKIKQDTHQIQFNAIVEKTEAGEEIKAKLTIDRSKYNVRYGSTSFFDSLGDKAIYDDFDLWINIKVK